jgi:hypothetical protein
MIPRSPEVWSSRTEVQQSKERKELYDAQARDVPAYDSGSSGGGA